MHVLTVYIFNGAITIVHGDRDGRRREVIDGVHRAAKSGGYCAAKSPLANVPIMYTGGSSVSTEANTTQTIKSNQPCAVSPAETVAMVD